MVAFNLILISFCFKAIYTAPKIPFFLLIYLFDSLFFRRVFFPKVFFPHGLRGDLCPMGAFPSPPPWGWSTAFIAEPRTVGRMPRQRLRPALPLFTKLFSLLLTSPIVARQFANIR